MGQLIKDTMVKLRGNCVRGALVVAVLGLVVTPTAVLADNGDRVEGGFTVSFMYASALDYCANGGTPIEAQGIGSVSELGPMLLTVKKCLTFPNGRGTYTGTFTMVASDGDSLKGTYAGTQDFSLVDENGFGPFQGKLTVTGGTGSFKHLRGTLGFAAVASPTSVGVTTPTVNGTAYYLVRGTVSQKH